MGLWCFGFDMDNMKARCWYDHQMPLIAIDSSYRENFIGLVSHLMTAAKDTVSLLRGQVKAAWFNRPKDAKGDTSMIDQAFWQATEAAFYQHLHSLTSLPSDTASIPANMAKQWVELLRNVAVSQFDTWVLEGDIEDRDMKRIFQSRKVLLGKLQTMKPLKSLWQLASTLKQISPATEDA